MLKIVLDTNIYLSALIFGGMVESIIDCIAANKLKLFVSSPLITEVRKKLHENGADEETVQKANAILTYKGILLHPNITIAACRDPEDNFVLELAETAQADYIITRDKDLLDLPGKVWKNTKIIKPENFLPILRKMKILV